jgi:hypothetical protein
MSGIKLLITDYTRAVRQYQNCDPLLVSRCAACATRAASAALAIALHSTNYYAVWHANSVEWAQRAYPHAEALG